MESEWFVIDGHSLFSHQKGGGKVDQMVTVIQNIGFPIVISFYLLHRVESKLDAIHLALLAMAKFTDDQSV